MASVLECDIVTAANQDIPDNLSFGLGDRMKKARRAARPWVTGQMVADDLGVQRSTISNYENGHHIPKLGVVRYYARRFEVSEAYLLRGSEVGADLPEDASRSMRGDASRRARHLSVA